MTIHFYLDYLTEWYLLIHALSHVQIDTPVLIAWKMVDVFGVEQQM